MKDLTLTPFQETDIQTLTPIMKRSFDKDSMEFLGHPDGPPGYDTGEFLREYALHEESTAFTITLKNRTIGAVILWISLTQINALGCLFVDSELQDKGIGSAVWKMIEEKYPDTKTWITETPWYTRRNHHFYINKCGFHVVGIDDPHSDDASYKMQKQMN